MGLIPDPGCSGGINDWRPFGLKFYKGKLYIGGMCTGETNNTSPSRDQSTIPVSTTDNIAEVSAWVLEIPNPTQNVTGNFVFSKNNFDFNRGRIVYYGANPEYDKIDGRWFAWTSTWDTDLFTVNSPDCGAPDCFLNYPQPILADIEFEADGSMLLGFKDRFADASKGGNTDTGDGTYTYSAGDLYKVCWNSSTTGSAFINGELGDWAWEGDTGCNFPQRNSGAEATSEWFHLDRTYSDIYNYTHEEQLFGGLAYKPVYGDVAVTSMNPNTNGGYSKAGVEYFDPQTGLNAGPLSYQILSSGSGNPVFAKSNGAGDVEYACEPAPLEIGNYVWCDSIANGIQDACEKGIDSMLVQLYDENGRLVGQDTTSNGNYYFNVLRPITLGQE